MMFAVATQLLHELRELVVFVVVMVSVVVKMVVKMMVMVVVVVVMVVVMVVMVMMVHMHMLVGMVVQMRLLSRWNLWQRFLLNHGFVIVFFKLSKLLIIKLIVEQLRVVEGIEIIIIKLRIFVLLEWRVLHHILNKLL